MKVTWRAVIAFIVLALGISVALWLSFDEHQEKQRRLSMWTHSLPHQQAPWSVLKWKRMLKQSGLPRPAYNVTQNTMMLTWSSVSAHDLLAKLAEWLPQSAWGVEQWRTGLNGSVIIKLKNNKNTCQKSKY